MSDEDKQWWTNFKEDQQILHPTETELNDYNDIWDVIEGEREIPRNDMITVPSRKSKPITVDDHPLTINDLDVDDIVIFDLVGKRYIGDILEIDEDEIIMIKLLLSADTIWNTFSNSLF